MQYVFVLDTNKVSCEPVHPAHARKLLKAGKAAVFRRYPFTLILKEERPEPPTELRLKVDPGSKTTGLALVDDSSGQVFWAATLEHRGQAIKDALEKRRAVRRSRRSRKTRYRKARFLNRRRKEGWSAPSLQSRVENILTWVKRLRTFSNVSALSMELVRFDTQKMRNPEIEGTEYQQGELFGYEVREYLLEKFDRQCVYCKAKNVPVEIEHIVPKSRGGSNAVSNLTLACRPCNQRKGNKTAEEFGHPKVQALAKRPLKDAAAVNVTRWTLYRRLQETGLPVEVGTGGRTKYNRARRELGKDHWLDAVCVGESTPEFLRLRGLEPLTIKAVGQGRRQLCLSDKYGFPRTKAKGPKRVFGFQSGDIVRAVVGNGKKTGTYVGKVAVRSRGSFNVTTKSGLATDMSYRYCRVLHRADGYSYC